MVKNKAGLLLYRFNIDIGEFDYFLLKPNKRAYNKKIWEIPKGNIENGETPIKAAIREFIEECYYYKDLEVNSFEKDIQNLIQNIINTTSMIYKKEYDDFNEELINVYAFKDPRPKNEWNKIPFRSKIYHNKKENITYSEILEWLYFPYSDIQNNPFILETHRKIIKSVNDDLTNNFYKKEKAKSFNQWHKINNLKNS